MARGTDFGFWSRNDVLLPGVWKEVVVARPAAGAEWSVAVPGGVRWRIGTAFALFTTSAAVANRTLGMQLTDGVNVRWRSAVTFTIPASTVNFSVSYWFASTNSIGSATGGWAELVVPPIWAPPGWTFGSWTTGIDVADQYTSILLYMEQLDDPESEIRVEPPASGY